MRDKLGFNKIAAAFCITGIVMLGSANLVDMIYNHEEIENKASSMFEDHGQNTQVDSTEVKDIKLSSAEILALVAKSAPSDGQKLIKQCAVCHTFNRGGHSKIGPNLWEIVGRNFASKEDFSYSKAMSSRNNEKWDAEQLFYFLEKPSRYLKGTKMAFAGIKNEKERAELISYLESLK